MVHFQRKLTVQYTGDDKYLPKGMKRGIVYPVVGYEAKNNARLFDDKPKEFTDIYYFVVCDGTLVKVSEQNCKTAIDEKSEIDVHQAIELLRNISIVGKVISEKMAEVHLEDGGKKNS